MTTKRRGGQKSGGYPLMGTTPGGGIPVPSMNDALSAMAAQLEAFSQEVRELKGLIRDLRNPVEATLPVAWEATEPLEVESFRRERKHRTVLLTAAIMVPLMLLAVWGMWPTRTPQQATPAVVPATVAKLRFAAPPPIPAPQPTAAVAVPSSPAPVPLPVSIQAPAPVVTPKNRTPIATAPIQAEFNEPVARSRTAHAALIANDQEHSGGAPILD